MNQALFDIWDGLKQQFPDLIFIESTHTYFIEGEKLPSVSTLLKNFYVPFDSEAMSLRYALKRGFGVEDVKDAWQGENTIANNKGHAVHLFGENYGKWKYFSIGEKPQVQCKQTLAIVEFWNDLPSHLVPVAFELQMYSKKYGYCGTADIILYNVKDGSFAIADYKGLDINTPILTETGWKTMGALTLQDRVFDKDGKLTKIIGMSEIKKDLPCFELMFSNNTSIIADYEHRWLVSFARSKGYLEKVMTTQELHDYLNSLTPKQRKSSYYKPKILNCKPIDSWLDISLPIDPYVLGVWLGDGSSQSGAITNMHDEIWAEIQSRGYSIGDDISGSSSGHATTRTVYGLYAQLKKLNLLNNKHLPDIYMLASPAQRLDLLRGFMDADGYYHKKKKHFVMGTTKKWQAEAIVQLVSSLGLTASIISAKKYCDGKIYDGYDVLFSGTINPFLCRNKEIANNPGQTHSTFLNIQEVRPVESRPTRCIEVESPSHTFLAGKNLTVTHNTNKKLIDDKHPQPPLLHISSDYGLKQDNYGKYSLQFSFYQILLEEIELTVSDRMLIYLNEEGDKLYQIFHTPNVTADLRKWLEENKN